MYDAEYWCDNIREPVYFAKTLGSAMADGHALFLEVGPHPVLSTSIKECILASGNPGASASTLRRKKPEMATFVDGICALYCAGLDLDWTALLPASTRLAPLPLYRFQRESHWFESPVASFSRLGVGDEGHPLLERRTATSNPTWETALNSGVMPYIPDHIIDGVVLFPGAGYIEAALAMHHRLTGFDETVLTDISFQRALVVDGGEDDPVISVTLDEESQRFNVHSRVSGTDDKWTAHASGVVSAVAADATEPVDLGSVRADCGEIVDVDDIYEALESRGLVYKDHFRRMTALSRGGNVALARIEPHPEPGRHFGNYRLHPTLLDGCFQSLISLLSAEHGGGSTFVPVSIDRLILRKSPEGGFWSVGELVDASPDSITGHLTLVDDEGDVLVQVRGFRCQALASGQQSLAGMLGKTAYEIDWEELDAVDMIERTGQVLVLSDGGEAVEALASKLADRDGVEPVLVTKADVLADPVALMTLLDDASDYAGVVWLHGSSQEAGDVEGLDEVDGFSTLIRAIDAAGKAPRVYGVTENAAAVVEGDAVGGAAQAPLAGLLRVALNEYPDLHCTAIDTDGTPESLDALAAEIVADSREDNLALRSGKRFGQRVVRARVKERDEALNDDQPETISADEAFELDQLAIGSIDSLALRQSERRAPGPNEIEVKVAATSLNFKDVAKAMNLMSDAALEGTFHGRGLGLEASGRVIRVGEGVTEYKVGDPVDFAVQGCFRRYATLEVNPSTIFKVPDSLDLVELSGIPTVFLTSYHALVNIANLQPGEKVLIHAGAGGVGLAAIQVAQWIGAEIFATAGSDEKRDYLRSLGVQHVMNSRSLDFAEQIHEITGARGVDVVLNSLPKEYIHKSLESLAPFGRFVEIGKKDLVDGTNISLLPFNKVLSFSTVDFDVMVAQRPDLSASLIQAIVPRFVSGEFKPVRTKIFPASELRDAFKYMARSQHIGKVVIQWDAEDTVEALPRPDQNRVFKSDASYLVTGGLGGFGLAMAEWLVGRGVRHLALVGRRGAASEEAKAGIAAMEAAGAVIDVMKVDITDRAQVKAMINELAGRDVPLKGVFHAAAVLDDAPISELDRERFEAVMRPKILGARYLDEATEGVDLDVFVLFSSVASVIGNARQANYVAANGWFDAFASNRRARGKPATSINWGPIADVGMAAGNAMLVKTLAASGFTPTTVQEGMEALEHTLRWDLAQTGLFDLDWSTWSSIEPTSGASPRFAGLVASDSDDLADNPLYNELLAMPNEDRTDVVGYLLIEQIAETLRIPPDKLEVTDSIGDLGMDSLMAVELQMMIKQRMGVELSALEMMKGENIGQMGGMILKKMNLDAGDPDAVPDVPDIDASAIDQMSDEDVEKLLQSAAE
jgi:NADPH:quinone reductase-like Zn-dependent oxidoreductase/acyl carrier protein